MISESLFVTFLITATLYGYVPGPAMLYVAAQTSAQGMRYGLLASLGIHIGTYAHVLGAAAGLTVLFHLFPQLYLSLKFAGALYLIWLGIGLFRPADPEAENGHGKDALQSPQRRRRPLLEGAVVEVLNPKTGLFFIAFLPQFTEAGSVAPTWLQFLVLGTVANVIFSSSDVVCALCADAVIKRLRGSTSRQAAVRALAGCLLIGLGLHLSLSG